ncbi:MULTISPECIES: thiamine pyrophosphate-dependent enzyme [Tissierellales]|mgnify:CR=1 FL=1|jgi:pyruvate ferredoxin oxidoreductase beta subunit|uniref:Pyruvate synthase subunit beta n=1 Tax=Acidilutibacter cellobiosedens TaxID=2507161 RepID=A0A410QAS0_9FIRM|nr:MULTISPECIES: thiamine pyrophosphate-dependent enzyme [Tissierellales]MBE6083507.1 pyruvate synthase subunit beta [Tissierellaceae bacterium]QAT61070.1 pyruvate synthase subunit beta [Acidilutibacter cellobiosedens]SCL89570.1 Pyruvate synthase subunit PorB [Sporanaerobacter sp. PP17-6a]
MIKMKELSDEELFYGHKACQGCGAGIVSRLAMKILGDKTIVVLPASCISSVTTIYPQMSFFTNSMTSSFPATGAVLSGISAACKAKGLNDVNVLGLAGDGGTADIGIQALSGAVERGNDFIYICYDNEAYMNTGIQRSSLTPYGAWTTTTPTNDGALGETKFKKNLFEIMMAHRIPYCATASVGYPFDFINKVTKAKKIKGPKFIHVLSPCPTGWGFDTDKTVEIGKLAVQTGLWYLAEYEKGKIRINIEPKSFKPVSEYLGGQKRFRHLNKGDFEVIEKHRDREWKALKNLVED